ncbi:MAG TPA: teicoplanin resistance protein VanZ [Sulfurimonas sp. UBA12504]|nr:MAG: hypothetical protein A2019_03575 [Sulfurimonas sp. GWF2_37_8]DAB31067.1 MAG TPA: teicoplanin resistance protein VanZ [Sulfurimonas sp. UBA12504]
MSWFFKGMFYFTLAVILYLATTTMQIKVVENIWDKANHFAAFFVLYILIHLAYKEVSLQSKVLILVIFGALIEIVQYFTPGRFFSLLDIFADSVGIAIGMSAYWLYEKKLRGVFS